MIELSKKTSDRIKLLFGNDEKQEVEDLLKIECGDNIPFCENRDQYGMERIRFAVLKLSKGNLGKLVEAIELAQIDWRDLLVAAGLVKMLRHTISGSHK